jgi:hypothetical protein
MNAYELASNLREVVADIRRKPYPISDLIPQLTSAADVLYEQAENIKHMELRETKYELRNQKQIQRIAELSQVLESIANEQIELSHDKIKWQCEDHIRWAKKVLYGAS